MILNGVDKIDEAAESNEDDKSQDHHFKNQLQPRQRAESQFEDLTVCGDYALPGLIYETE